MKIEKTNGFVVWEESNKTDGYGPSFICAATNTQESAENKAIGRGVMGLPGRIGKREVFVFEFNGKKYCVPVDQCSEID